jgi:lysophospholipase L1-like esterase
MKYAVFVYALTFAQTADAPKARDPKRWEAAIQAFEQQDENARPPKEPILFVGSSSIRMWKLEKSFPDLPVLNRGFGGSVVADTVYFADRIVTNYKPSVIVFYAGDNDIAEGKSPEQVRDDFQALAEIVGKELPKTRLLFLSIKPSPSRLKFREKQKQANGLIQAYCRGRANLVYIDSGEVLLSDGKPDPRLFLNDGLHMNAQGYEKWAKLLKPHLEAAKRE